MTPPNWEMTKERWESVSRVRRDSCLGFGVCVEGDQEVREKDEGWTNTVVDRTDSAIMIVVNNKCLEDCPNLDYLLQFRLYNCRITSANIVLKVRIYKTNQCPHLFQPNPALRGSMTLPHVAPSSVNQSMSGSP